MKKIILWLIAIIILTGTARADDFATFDVSVYAADETDFNGFMVGTTIGTTWVAQLNINSAENLGGLSLAFGKRVGEFTLLAGALYGSDLETVKRDIDVAGIATRGQDTPEFDNPPLFIELEHSSGFFVRYTEYKAEYTIDATRFELVDPGPPPVYNAFSASEDFEIDDSVVFLGYRLKF